jgi:hypothetical protein
MRDEEREAATAYGFGDFFKGIRGAVRKKRLYAAIDRGREGLRELKIADTDGEAIAVLASAYAKTLGLLKFFREKKISDLNTEAGVRRFVELYGRYAAEQYLRARKEAVSQEPSLLALAVSREELVSLIRSMQATGTAAEGADDLGGEPFDEASLEEAAEMLAGVLGRYESAIPPVDEDGSVPNRIQDRGIAKAAFLGLRAKDLRQVSKGSGDELEGATKELLANKLADEYAGKEQEIAEIVLGGARDDPTSGVVTRLMPLEEASKHLDEVASRLQPLKGRYYETGAAEWFCFREIQRERAMLTIRGQILGYRVSVTEVKDEPRLQPTRQRETVTIQLRDGIAWAETNARRAGHLSAIRRVLLRTELARPRAALIPPDAVAEDPFSRCDSRTLWILEFLSRELSDDPFRVDDHLMVNFERPSSAKSSSVGDGGGSERRPTVTAVRLKGMLLIDHPEVCDLILRRRRIVDIDLALQVKTAKTDPKFYPRLRVRLSWANDHLALISQPPEETTEHIKLHHKLVGDLRRAATRPIDSSYIALPMQRIVVNAGQAESDELDSVLGDGEPPEAASS